MTASRHTTGTPSGYWTENRAALWWGRHASTPCGAFVPPFRGPPSESAPQRRVVVPFDRRPCTSCGAARVAASQSVSGRRQTALWATTRHSEGEKAEVAGGESSDEKVEAAATLQGVNVKRHPEEKTEGRTSEVLEGLDGNLGKELLSGLEMVERLAEMGLKKNTNKPQGRKVTPAFNEAKSPVNSADGGGSYMVETTAVMPTDAEGTRESPSATLDGSVPPVVSSGLQRHRPRKADSGLRRKVSRLAGALKSLQDFVGSWGSQGAMGGARRQLFEDDVLQDVSGGARRRGRGTGWSYRGRLAALESADDTDTTASDSDVYDMRRDYLRDYSDSEESEFEEERRFRSPRSRYSDDKFGAWERHMPKLRRLYSKLHERAERDRLFRALAKHFPRLRRTGRAGGRNSSGEENESSLLGSDDIGAVRRREGRKLTRNRARRIMDAAEQAVYPDTTDMEGGGERTMVRGWRRREDAGLNIWTDDNEDNDSGGETDMVGDDTEDSTEVEGQMLWSGGTEVGLKNYQHDVPVDKGLLERQLHIIKDIMGLQRTNVGIELIDDNRIRELNFQFLGNNKSTDILSFPYTDNPDILRAFPLLRSLRASPDIALGYIFINPAFVQRRCDDDRASMEESILHNVSGQPNERGIAGVLRNQFTVQERLPLLLIRGLLQLLKYDNNDTADKEQLIEKEERIASEFLLRSREHRPSSGGHYVVGMGTDVCYIPRIKESIEKHEGRFLEHVCSPREKQQYRLMKDRYLEDVASNKMKRQSWHDVAAAYLAKRFATKEAVAKALGTGLRHVTDAGVRLQDIEVWSIPSGQPTVQLLGRARDIGQRLGVVDVMVAQTDERDYAVSFATACGSTGDIIPTVYGRDAT
eukprot:GHVS01020117.1.p1 GENE.GHVS01020117.1~~GHVS01020117.1.p1  ORF type:complete len:974 (+),score=112.42 GHVS01020117.1:318-2924(+)